MRNIILNLAVSLDSFIAGPNGEYDWCFTDADYGMTAFMKSLDATLMGRKTYELVAGEGKPYPELTNYVFSKSLQETEFENVRIISTDIVPFVKNLKEQPGKNIWLYGGAQLIAPILEHDLVDELQLSVHPILLGGGIPLFKKITIRKYFKLADVIKYPSGLVQLIYKK
jgi:dihydrofolate reductase